MHLPVEQSRTTNRCGLPCTESVILQDGIQQPAVRNRVQFPLRCGSPRLLHRPACLWLTVSQPHAEPRKPIDNAVLSRTRIINPCAVSAKVVSGSVCV